MAWGNNTGTSHFLPDSQLLGISRVVGLLDRLLDGCPNRQCPCKHDAVTQFLQLAVLGVVVSRLVDSSEHITCVSKDGVLVQFQLLAPGHPYPLYIVGQIFSEHIK